MQLKKYTYTWRGDDVIVYAESGDYADTLFSKVINNGYKDDDDHYNHIYNEHIIIQTKPMPTAPET